MFEVNEKNVNMTKAFLHIKLRSDYSNSAETSN